MFFTLPGQEGKHIGWPILHGTLHAVVSPKCHLHGVCLYTWPQASGWFCTIIQIAQGLMQIYSTGPHKEQHTEFHLCGIFKGIFVYACAPAGFTNHYIKYCSCTTYTVDMVSDGETYYLIPIILLCLVLQYIPCDWLLIIKSHMTNFSWPKYILIILCAK